MNKVNQPADVKLGIGISNVELRKVRLRNSLAIISSLIEKGNENLWPIFEKLENELVKLEERRLKLSRYS